MTENEIMSAVVGPDHQGRCKNTIGFFVEEWFENGDIKLLDEYFVQKPIVEISEFSDENNQQYYCVNFVYKSKRDEDLKQQWCFMDYFVSKSLQNVDKQDSIVVLLVSLVPFAYNGKYSVFAKFGIPNSIVYTEQAIDGVCTIKILFLKENVCVMSNDEDLVDKQTIEYEVSAELDAEIENDKIASMPIEND